MADQIQEALEVPRDFLREGVQFVNKCQKRACRTHLCNYLLLIQNADNTLPYSDYQRICLPLSSRWSWFLGDGIRWLCGQA